MESAQPGIEFEAASPITGLIADFSRVFWDVYSSDIYNVSTTRFVAPYESHSAWIARKSAPVIVADVRSNGLSTGHYDTQFPADYDYVDISDSSTNPLETGFEKQRCLLACLAKE